MNTRVTGCSSVRPSRRTYDHRLREAIVAARDPALFESCLSIPPSTIRSWLNQGLPRVVSLDEGDFEVAELRLVFELVATGLRQTERSAVRCAHPKPV